MTIFVDMDMTLNKMWISVCDILAEEYGESAILDRDQLLSYKIPSNVPTIPENRWDELINNIFITPGFWESIPLWEDAVRIMAELVEKHDVFIVTKPWIHYDRCSMEKIHWIQDHLPFFNLENFICTGHKHLLKGDFIIDDAPQYMTIDNGIKIIAFDYPYNRQFKVHFRALSWLDIGDFFGVS